MFTLLSIGVSCCRQSSHWKATYKVVVHTQCRVEDLHVPTMVEVLPSLPLTSFPVPLLCWPPCILYVSNTNPTHVHHGGLLGWHFHSSVCMHYVHANFL